MSVSPAVLLPVAFAMCSAFAEAEYGLSTVVTRQAPASIITNGHGRVFVDFGKAAFGWLELVPPDGFTGGVYQVSVAEAKHEDDTTDTWKGGSIRCWNSAPTSIPAAERVHRVKMPPNRKNTYFAGNPPPVRLRPETGVVMPFRYVEFYALPFEITPRTIRRAMVHYPLDMEESSFECSDPRLVQVYDFCKYTILATSFAGLYVDGDRERVPYEADAYINQLGHYAISSDRALARASHEYLLRHPTWPTEWKQHSIMMAWADWMWSGSIGSAGRHYDVLKEKEIVISKVECIHYYRGGDRYHITSTDNEKYMVVGKYDDLLLKERLKEGVSATVKYSQNRLPFGRKVGLGTVIIGAAIIVFSALSAVTLYTDSSLFILLGTGILIAGIVFGMVISFKAMIKYNKGIF